MTFRDVSGIVAWGMLYLCSVESSKELTQKIGPIPPRLWRIISYNLVLLRNGKSVGAWLRMVCRPFSIFNKARTRSFDTNTLTFDISQNP